MKEKLRSQRSKKLKVSQEHLKVYTEFAINTELILLLRQPQIVSEAEHTYFDQ